MEAVSFKSIPENFRKERDGLKPCTLRKIDMADDRFQRLGAWMLSGHYGEIVIWNSDTLEKFQRKVTDLTVWEGWLIISWNPNVKN